MATSLTGFAGGVWHGGSSAAGGSGPPCELGGEVGATGESQLGEDVGEVCLDGAAGDVQAGADLGVGKTVGGKPADVAFHRGQ